MRKSAGDKRIDIADVFQLPLEKKSQENAVRDNLPSVLEKRLKLYNAGQNNPDAF